MPPRPKTVIGALIGAALIGAAMAATLAPAPAEAQDNRIRIGWTAWSDAEALTKLAERVLEDRMNYDVELVLADIGLQYQGLADGDLDAMLMSWLPLTHAAYMERVGDRIVPLGILYTGARLGWAVPAYVPEDQLGSIADLTNPEVRERLSGQIQGIDPGAGLMQASERAIEAYGLDGYDLVSASGAAMTAALDRAIRREQWIVVTAWSPHWMFSRHDIRYLDDPQGSLGGQERVHVMARQGFDQDYPEATAFLARMSLPLDELEALMLQATETSYEEAVAAYIAEHPARVNYWATGEIDESGS